MARLSDIRIIYKRVGLWTFARRVWAQVGEDDLLTRGAAMAYAWLFAVFPFFIFLLSLLPYLPEDIRGKAGVNIKEFLDNNLNERASQVLWENTQRMLQQPKGGLLSFGVLLTIWGASGGMAMTITALDRCYELSKGRSFFKHRLVASMLTVIVASFIIVVMILLPVGTLITRWLVHHDLLPFGLSIILDIARWLLALLIMLTLVALVYYFGPAVRQRFHVLTPGAVFAIIVWIMLGLIFRLYVDKVLTESYNRTYGTVGGVAILLLSFYIDAVVLLIGAEINSEVDFEVLGVPRGSRDLRAAIAREPIDGI